MGSERTRSEALLQDVTKQQAKDRAAARRLVAGQGTLDKYLPPATRKASQDKQVKQLLLHHSIMCLLMAAQAAMMQELAILCLCHVQPL